jgi:hypothetical protein
MARKKAQPDKALPETDKAGELGDKLTPKPKPPDKPAIPVVDTSNLTAIPLPFRGEESQQEGQEKPPEGQEKPPEGQEKPPEGQEKPPKGQKPHEGQENPTESQVAEAQELLPDLTVTARLQPDQDRLALAQQLTKEIRADIHSAMTKLWRVQREELWRELNYTGFEEYCLMEFNKTRKWGYEQITMVKAGNALAAKGVENPLANLSKEAALVYRQWENRPEVFTLACLQILEDDGALTKKALEAECPIQAEYLRQADLVSGWTQEEFRAYRKLDHIAHSYEINEFIVNSRPNADQLGGECLRLKKKPGITDLAKVVRGADLVKLVADLEPLARDMAKVPELQKALAELKEKRKRANEIKTEFDKDIHAHEQEIAKLRGVAQQPQQEEEEEEEEDQAYKEAYEDFTKDVRDYIERLALGLEVVADHTDELSDDVKKDVDRMIEATAKIAEAWDKEEPKTVEDAIKEEEDSILEPNNNDGSSD